MPYVLTHFGTTLLPDAMPEDDLSTGQVDTSLVDSIGSAFNYFGSVQRLPRKQQVSHKGKYVGEMLYRVTDNGDYRVTSSGDYRVTAESAVADLAGKVGDLKARLGSWDQLWRKRIADSELTWKQCRLLQVKHNETVDNADVVSEVESIFETLQAGWRSAAATTTSASLIAGTTTVLVAPNAGSMLVRDAILRVARTSGTITQVQVTGTGIDFTWTGSIGASQTLTIDAGAQTVLIGTSEQYSGLVLNAGHTADEWLPLAVGNATILVRLTGGNGNVSIEHYNRWP